MGSCAPGHRMACSRVCPVGAATAAAHSFCPLLATLSPLPSSTQGLRLQSDARSGVEVTVADSTYSLADIHHGSGALKRLDSMRANGFAAAHPFDAFGATIMSVPVMRVRITHLA